MKKLLIALCMSFAVAVSADAQWFVGGNISYSETSARMDLSESYGGYVDRQYSGRYTTMQVTISPRAGYMFNDRWLAGLELGYGMQKRNPDEDSGDDTIRTNSFSVAPFVRCNFLWFGPFMLGLEASATCSFGRVKYDQDWDVQKNTTRMYGGEIAPVLELDVSKNLSLECRLNFLSIGYFHTRNKTIMEREGYSYRNTTSANITTGMISGDEVFRLGDLTFGVIYKF